MSYRDPSSALHPSPSTHPDSFTYDSVMNALSLSQQNLNDEQSFSRHLHELLSYMENQRDLLIRQIEEKPVSYGFIPRVYSSMKMMTSYAERSGNCYLRDDPLPYRWSGSRWTHETPQTHTYWIMRASQGYSSTISDDPPCEGCERITDDGSEIWVTHESLEQISDRAGRIVFYPKSDLQVHETLDGEVIIYDHYIE